MDDSRSRDVTGIINSLIVDDTLSLTVKNPLLAGDPAPNQPKQLHIDYELDGTRAQTTVPEHRTLQIGSPKLGPPPLQLAVNAAGAPNLRAFTPGAVSFKTASGRSFRAEVAAVPAPVRLAGPWSLRFPPGWGAPAEITLPELICWTESPEPGVKYFSGTASYQMAFDWKPEYGGRKPEIILDLGKVHEIAEVRINGQDLGILWKPPFRVEITDAIKPGANELEIRVTNLWPNRMIGDENLPPDREWVDRGPGAEIKEWPQWLLDGQPSPAGRFTFATWHHWKKGDPLLPSGLIGPVVLRSQVTVPAIRE